jgi:glucose-6-phosphate dehydrogenase assembly protein OpcA
MTLIAVAPGDEQAYAATNALRSLGGHHPARIVILRPDPDSAASLDARATLYALQNDGPRVTFEEITLSVRGQAARHLDSLVEAFTLSDLPVAVWYVNSLPEPTDPLLTVASAVILDSREADEEGPLRALVELTRRRVVVDLSWIRLGPWRELLATLFDAPEQRAWLGGVDSVEVTGKPGPRRLLGGWLYGQLGLSPRQVNLRDGRHVEVKLTSTVDGRQATFAVERGEADRVLKARASLPDGRTLRQTASLADEPLATSLALALTHLRPDPIWEKALYMATMLGP